MGKYPWVSSVEVGSRSSRELIQPVQLTWLHCLLNLSLIHCGFLHGCLQLFFPSARTCHTWRKERCSGRFVFYLTPRFMCFCSSGKRKNSALLLNIQTKYFVIMVSEYELFIQNNIITLYLLFVLLVSLRMFLWEDLRGLFSADGNGCKKCFTALLRAFSLQSEGLNLNEDLF